MYGGGNFGDQFLYSILEWSYLFSEDTNLEKIASWKYSLLLLDTIDLAWMLQYST